MSATIHTDRFEPDTAADHDCPHDDALDTARAHREQFPFAWLPDDVRTAFDEALRCYSADLFHAFALMCRCTASRSIKSLEDTHAQHWRETCREIIRIGDVDETAAEAIEQLLFGEESSIPMIDLTVAAVLLEVMKDVLYQCHVRGAKFRAAIRVRRFFAEEQSSKLTTLRRPRGTALAG
ncbi:MAG: hypothetical protein PVF50_01465 [Gammaproteobacteria bacterium]